MDDFSELVDLRKRLLNAVVHHATTVEWFRRPNGSFYRTARDRKQEVPAGSPISGLTTAFTCLESLGDAGNITRQTAIAASRPYVANVLAHPDDWKSEDAARIYCRARSLAPLLRMVGDELTASEHINVDKLLQYVWTGVEAVAGADGIFELGDVAHQDPTAVVVEDRYPPNAYLTYWGLASLEAAISASIDLTDLPALNAKREIAALGLEKCIGTQVALHQIGSRRCDPQQIAWAVCGLVKADAKPLAERPTPTRELVEAGLQVFFERQDDDGTWPRGDPLFHYPKAGNAYCYPFETLAELVTLALDGTQTAPELRSLLQPYGTHLRRAFDYALRTSRPVRESAAMRGWCSEHHPHRRSPESWATATVYRFFQSMRRLVGIWTREHVSRVMRASVPTQNLALVKERGDTWNAGYGSAGVQLCSMFVHPLGAIVRPGAPDDPDVLPFPDDGYARSAILYGPPGTGKTNLAEAVAGALGWNYVEVTPAHFLGGGMDLVSARADEVFDMLMQLDRHVVLFDEIDELIRTRTEATSPLERFFTTTMLPRLAKLWKEKKLIFFVNTNSMGHVDPAIRRAQRFDAAIFVLPPSAAVKAARLGAESAMVDVDRCQEVLSWSSHHGHEDNQGWWPFVRFDQLDRLRAQMSSHAGTEEKLKELNRVGREVFNSDWVDEASTNGDAAEEAELDGPQPPTDERLKVATLVFQRQGKHQRRDDARHRVVRVETPGLPTPPGVETIEGASDFWRVLTSEHDLLAWADTNGVTLSPAATVEAVDVPADIGDAAV